MIVTGKMRHLTGAVLHSDSDAVTRELLNLGVLDFISFKDIPGEWTSSLQPVSGESEQRRVLQLRERIETFFGVLGEHPAEHARFSETDQAFSASLDETERQLDKLASRIQRVREEQRKIHQELNKTRELQRHLQSQGGGEAARHDHPYLNIRSGRPAAGREADFRTALQQYPSMYMDNGLLMTMKRDESAISAILGTFGWTDQPLPQEPLSEEPSPEEQKLPDRELARKEEELRSRNEELEGSVKTLVQEQKAELLNLWKGFRIRELSGTIRSFYGKTEKTVLFSGWVPAHREKEVDERLRRVSGGRCHLEWRSPAGTMAEEMPKQVPVIMNNPTWLRPFEKLVTNYAIPAYGTIDPTIFVAIFYCAMFGLMFGDVGHGFVVLLVGILGKLRRGRKEEHFLFPLFRWCGASAMVAGLLFGSWFGYPLTDPLWFDYHGIVNGHQGTGAVQAISDILLITIYFGIMVIALGLILNWFNRIAKRDWIGLILDKGGLLGGWMYGAGTWTAFHFVRHSYRELPDTNLLALILGLPALMMAIKPVLEWRHHHKGESFGAMTVVNLLMEWIVELLEIFSGYLSNTLSFMRVAGLGIAHVSLMVAFFQIADMAAGPGGYSIWSVIILIFGNILVIGLEGLSAGIQSLRLNYYEFFSRYFDGSGRAYAPVSLKK